nr:Fe-S cluster assembly protein SufB [Candidatus Woesearchaeota archaeon]
MEQETTGFIVNREIYDHKNQERHKLKASPGLNEEVIRLISQRKNEPEWMLDKRLKAFEIFKKLKMPDWGPDISLLINELNNITFYIDPDAKKNARSWDDVPEDIKKTFEKLGIPEAERKSLAGAGAQYESQTVYHNLKKEWEDKGVIFEDMDKALQEYPNIVKKYFMTNCVSPSLHKFAALHAAVWSGGTFLYVPENVKVDLPMQAYFRMNAEKMGQFEHTLIVVEKNAQVHYIEGCSSPRYDESSLHAGCVEVHVKENARARYSSIENWSRNTYNLNTKRAVVDKNGIIEWVNGNMGSICTMLYPTSVLRGENARSDFIGIALAGKGQNQDTGTKVYHLAPNTKSTIKSKSISMDGGITTYRGLLKIGKNAVNSKSNVQCDALMMDDISKSNTIPYMEINQDKVDVGHEASVGKISEEQVFYLMSRGLNEEQARQMIVSGFIEPVIKELPMEYAVELNRLIQLEMEGSLG